MLTGTYADDMKGGEDINIVSQTGIIPLKGRDVLTLGSSYMSDIFYNYNNKVAPKEKVLIVGDGEIIIKNDFQNRDDLMDESDYTKEQTVLRYGDEFRMYGLWMQYLGSILIVCSFFGELRVAVAKRRS